MKEFAKPKILVVGPTPPPFQGVSVVTQILLNSRLAEEFDLVHLDTSDRRSMANSERLDWRNVYLALLHGFTCWWLLLKKRPAIVYAPISQSALGFLRDSLFMIPAKWIGSRLVVHLHGGAFDRFFAGANLATRVLVRFCLARADVAIVLSSKFLRIFSGLVEAESVVVVENGVVDDFAGDPRASAQNLQVLYIGTLVESKGFVDLLHAVPSVLRQVPNVEFVFVGDGTGYAEFDRAQTWVAERGLEQYVKFPGSKWGEEKKCALLNADVFSFPTWYPYEGQPLVVLEAMAAGLPIVTTRHAAIENTLGETGALYSRPQDPENLAAQLVTVLKDPRLRAAMGRQNRQRFVERYTAECFAANLSAVFNRVLGLTQPTLGPAVRNAAH